MKFRWACNGQYLVHFYQGKVRFFSMQTGMKIAKATWLQARSEIKQTFYDVERNTFYSLMGNFEGINAVAMWSIPNLKRAPRQDANQVSVSQGTERIFELATDAEEMPDVVGIDEVQFFDEEIVAVCNRMADRGIRVIAAGLDLDYLGRPFGCMPLLLTHAEYVTKLHAICTITGRPAHFSHRVEGGDEDVQIGGAESYQALSREPYNEVVVRSHHRVTSSE